MKRLLFITLIIITSVLAGVLHGGYVQDEREVYTKAVGAYTGLFPEKMPPVVLDSTVLPAPLL